MVRLIFFSNVFENDTDQFLFRNLDELHRLIRRQCICTQIKHAALRPIVF